VLFGAAAEPIRHRCRGDVVLFGAAAEPSFVIGAAVTFLLGRPPPHAHLAVPTKILAAPAPRTD
jgi:hypothetical protein